MAQFLAVTFVIAWFIFWGYILLTNPRVFFDTNTMAQKNMDRGFSGLGKMIGFGLKLFK